MIDAKTQEILSANDNTYSDMLELAEELPDSSPRFVLLSYPLTMVRYVSFFTIPSHGTFPLYFPLPSLSAPYKLSRLVPTQPSGRMSVPYVLLYYLPVNCNPNLRMSYAGAVELMRSTAEVNRVIQIGESEELEEIEGKLKGED